MAQRAEIIFEVEETVVIKQCGKIVTDLCPRCGSEVEMVSPELLAMLAGKAEREIFRAIEAGQIYFIEPDRIYACAGCYRRLLEKNRGESQSQYRNQAAIEDPSDDGMKRKEK